MLQQMRLMMLTVHSGALNAWISRDKKNKEEKKNISLKWEDFWWSSSNVILVRGEGGNKEVLKQANRAEQQEEAMFW